MDKVIAYQYDHVLISQYREKQKDWLIVKVENGYAFTSVPRIGALVDFCKGSPSALEAYGLFFGLYFIVSLAYSLNPLKKYYYL